jgi:hypothetical protein
MKSAREWQKLLDGQVTAVSIAAIQADAIRAAAEYVRPILEMEKQLLEEADRLFPKT